MPYVITTGKRFDFTDTNVWGVQVTSRRAVATLDEAQNYVASIAHDVNPKRVYALRIYANVGASGGTVGPLPDGTVIRVALVKWDDLVLPQTPIYPTTPTPRAILDAYNAAQE